MNELPKGSIEFAAAAGIAALALIDPAIGAVVAVIAFATLGGYRVIAPDSTGTPDTLKSIVQEEAKRKNLQEIVTFVDKKGAVTKTEIEEKLDISDDTAENYIEELVAEEKIEKVGGEEEDVAYRLK